MKIMTNVQIGCNLSFNTHPSCLSMIPSVQNWGWPSIMNMNQTIIQVLPEGSVVPEVLDLAFNE